MADLNAAEIKKFRQRLQDRREALRKIMHDDLVATRREEYRDLAGQVYDIGDQSIAELLMGVELSGRGRELQEMQDVEAALTRIQQGTFGICIDCRSPIELDRLQAYPTAKRCLRCQQRYEKNRSGGKDATPSL